MTTKLFSSARAVAAAAVLLLALPDPSAAQRRNREPGDPGGGSQAVPRERAPQPAPPPAAPPPAPAPPQPPAPSTAPPPETTRGTGRTAPAIVTEDDGADSRSAPGARPREGRRVVGTAVPRGSVPPPRRDTVIVPAYRGYWPWGYSGLGFGSYYGRYYDPYVFYDPYAPWYGSARYGAYAYSAFDGSLRLKVRPRDAQVFVDGYYVGIVDEFDGVFQRLKLPAGPHRIEIRAPGFETLTFDVQIRWDDTTTFEGELRRGP
jgi:hypothetical protein